MANSAINYRLVAIELVHKNMNAVRQLEPGQPMRFDIQVEMRINAENRLVIPFVTVNIRLGEGDEQLASIGVSCLFEVDDFDRHIIKNAEGLYTVPEILEMTFRPIAISTTRGVMFSEFRGTFLNNAILPVVPLTSTQVPPSPR